MPTFGLCFVPVVWETHPLMVLAGGGRIKGQVCGEGDGHRVRAPELPGPSAVARICPGAVTNILWAFLGGLATSLAHVSAWSSSRRRAQW